MDTAIIISKLDLAGMNIKESLTSLFNFKKINEKFENNEVYQLQSENIKICTVNKESIFNEGIDKKIDAELFIFATKHQSKENVSSLSCHAPGNWLKAEFGGQDRKLCVAPAKILKEAFLKLNELNKENKFNVTLECTHHGPYLEKPVFFIEIGSSEKEWGNKEAGNLVANTIYSILLSIEEINKKDYKIAFGIGGPHYCNLFNKVMLKTGIALAHICPKYQLQHLDKEMISQAITKTREKTDFVLLDWKGLGKEKQRILGMLNELKIRYERSDKILF